MIEPENVLAHIRGKFMDSEAKVIFHPDGDNTFAAYQVIYEGGKLEYWINARTGDCIGSGRIRNRLS